MKRYIDYDNFAWLYNQEWRIYSEGIFPLLKHIAGARLNEGAKVLDLCCGTGQLAKVLTEKGYKVTGIDSSLKMLKFARSNAPDARFMTADARNFKLPRVFNAVFSTFDSLNHIMKLEELQQVFDNVNRCLVPGGIFIFDMTTEKQFTAHASGWKDFKDNPEYFYLIREEFDRESKKSQVRFTIFRRKARGWQRSDIVLEQTYYPNAAIKKALQKVGFTDIQSYSVDAKRGLQKPTKNSVRIFFCAQKP